MLITGNDVLQVLGCRLKKARTDKKLTQDFVAENVNISTDLLRNIENGRNIGSIPTLLNLCNFLEITPDTLFEPLLTTEKQTLDTSLTKYISSISKEDKEVLKKIIIHIDKNYWVIITQKTHTLHFSVSFIFIMYC